MESKKLILVKAEMMEIKKTEMADPALERLSLALLDLRKHPHQHRYAKENELISLATILDMMNVMMETTLLLMADTIEKSNTDGNVLTEVRGTLMFAPNFEATVLTMENMNVTMAIISMETVDLQHAQSNKMAIKTNGFAAAVMKKHLTFVTSGEVTVSDSKIRGYGIRDVTCSDFKKSLEMKATSEVVKDVTEYAESKKALFDQVEVQLILTFEAKNEAIDEPSITISEMMATTIMAMDVIVYAIWRQAINVCRALLTMSACVQKFVEITLTMDGTHETMEIS